jgi:regulator of sigma E protease
METKMTGVFSTCVSPLLAASFPTESLQTVWYYFLILMGFSFIIFIHELGHFLAAKWAGVRVEQFAIGFFREIIGFTKGETRYSFNLLPLGGYVKMLGQEDFEVDKSGELAVKDDPRSYTNKPVGKRMIIVSAGVIMNLLLAAVLFMIVFMVGLEAPEPRVGVVFPDGPADLAGLQPDDEVLSINGETINDFNEITMAVVLAKPNENLDFEVRRNGELKTFAFQPKEDPQLGRLQIGMTAAQSPIIVAVGPKYELSNPADPRPGDVVASINGKEVTEQNANSMLADLFTNPLGIESVVVKRPKDLTAEEPEYTEQPVTLHPGLEIRRADAGKNRPQLLGLAPFTQIDAVEPGSRADFAGLQVGDIVLEVDGIKNPGPQDISDKIASADPERDLPFLVLHKKASRPAWVYARPYVKVMPLSGKRKPPRLGIGYSGIADRFPRVAAIVPEIIGRPTPAMEAGIPENAVIRTVAGEPVASWLDIARAFQAHAGETVALGYDHDATKGQTAEFAVPHSLRTKLGVGPAARIVSVAGEKYTMVSRQEAGVDVDDEDADKETKVSVGHPLGLRTILRAHAGETVEIVYREDPLAPSKTVQVDVTEEMTEPWVGLLTYGVGLDFGGQMTLIQKSNPIAAVEVGVKRTYYFVMQVYQVLQRMIFARSLGVENIQGPVGILKTGRRVAERGFAQMLFFLAMISANLAVINFLPLPIVDGGHMVFLTIEKIKGSPVSVSVQIATQVIGLVLIGAAFLYVTVNDLVR